MYIRVAQRDTFRKRYRIAPRQPRASRWVTTIYAKIDHDSSQPPPIDRSINYQQRQEKCSSLIFFTLKTQWRLLSSLLLPVCLIQKLSNSRNQKPFVLSMFKCRDLFFGRNNFHSLQGCSFPADEASERNYLPQVPVGWLAGCVLQPATESESRCMMTTAGNATHTINSGNNTSLMNCKRNNFARRTLNVFKCRSRSLWCVAR